LTVINTLVDLNEVWQFANVL